MGFIDAGFYPDISSGKEEKCVTQFCHQLEKTTDHLLSSIQTLKTKETLVELAKHQLQGKINFKQVVCKETLLVDGVTE